MSSIKQTKKGNIQNKNKNPEKIQEKIDENIEEKKEEKKEEKIKKRKKKYNDIVFLIPETRYHIVKSVGIIIIEKIKFHN